MTKAEVTEVGNLVEIDDSIFNAVRDFTSRQDDKERIFVKDFVTGQTLNIRDLESQSLKLVLVY